MDWMQGGFTFSKSGFYLNDPLVHNGHSTKEEKRQKKGEEGGGRASREIVFPCRGGMSSINRP